jgi:hypothetical protein
MLVHLLPRPASEVLVPEGTFACWLINYFLCGSYGKIKMQSASLVARKLPSPTLFARVIKPGAKPLLFRTGLTRSELPSERVFRA